MAAELKVFSDALCATELTSVAGQYSTFVGPQIGLDGDNGEVWSGVLYVKNTGDQPAIYVKALLGNDQNHFMYISSDGEHYTTDSYITPPAGASNDYRLAVGAVMPIYAKIEIPGGTETAQWTPYLTVTYKTLP